MPLMVLGIIFGLSSAAQAQGGPYTCAITATPASRATATGHTETSGDLLVTCTAPAGAAAASAAVLNVDYGVSITNSTAHPPGRPITITTTGILAGSTIGAINTTNGTLPVNVPAQGACVGGCSGTASIQGVLLSLAGTGKSSVVATLSIATPGAGFLTNGAADSATTISTVLAGIKDPVISPIPGIAVMAANGTSFDTTFGIDITENYVDMFRESKQFNCAPATAGIVAPICGSVYAGFPQTDGADTQIRLQFVNIQPGVVLGACGAVATKADGTASTLAPVVSSVTVDQFVPNITINFGGPADLAQIETVTFTCGTISTVGATFPLTGGNITVQATLAPTGAALGNLGAVNTSLTTGQVPRYAQTLQPATALTVVSIVPATTNLLVPFAVAGPGFDTGIAISNTTADPFGATTGGATPGNGTITYTFFPNGGTSFSFTTGAAGTPTGNGGLTSGVLNAGNTYSVLVSELLKAAGKGPAFSGYLFVTTNFTNAHGVAFAVSNFDGKFTSYTPVLVLPPPAGFSRGAPIGGAEQLDQ
jgi:hypothetical protein